jgi:hypothetical protein
MIALLIFLCGVSILLWAGNRPARWQGQPQGITPRQRPSFWTVLGWLAMTCIGMSALVLVCLGWLFAILRR